LILCIAVKLFAEGSPEEGADEQAANLWLAVRIIVIADITMSLDNMLAVAGASNGNLFLLLFGLGLSIPFVVLTSNLLSILMDRYPYIIYLGSAILGKVCAEMIFTDPILHWRRFLMADRRPGFPNKLAQYLILSNTRLGRRSPAQQILPQPGACLDSMPRSKSGRIRPALFPVGSGWGFPRPGV